MQCHSYLAFTNRFNLKEIHFFDSDPLAMQKFQLNLTGNSVKLTDRQNATEAVNNANLITTCTAD